MHLLFSQYNHNITVGPGTCAKHMDIALAPQVPPLATGLLLPACSWFHRLLFRPINLKKQRQSAALFRNLNFSCMKDLSRFPLISSKNKAPSQKPITYKSLQLSPVLNVINSFVTAAGKNQRFGFNLTLVQRVVQSSIFTLTTALFVTFVEQTCILTVCKLTERTDEYTSSSLVLGVFKIPM